MPSRETDSAVGAVGAAWNTTDEAAREAAVMVMTSPPIPPAPAYRVASTVTIENCTAPPAESIDDVLSQLVIHEDRPIENLPVMVSAELKLIGRCVSLCIVQTINGATAPYYYTGLVSMVTDTTVTLMYANRYARADFIFYQSRERRIADLMEKEDRHALAQRRTSNVGGGGVAASQQPRGTRPKGLSFSSADQPAGTEFGDTPAPLLPGRNPGGSLAAALRVSLEPATGRESGDDTAVGCGRAVQEKDGARRSQRRLNFRICAESLGVLPFVTFLRSNIRDVAFGRDPSSDFYALFTDPSRQLMDMQFLRTFVRRYLVHTSEGSNQRQVPMYAFLTAHGGCPYLDRGLAAQMAREELPRLMQVDRAIVKANRRQLRREARVSDAVQIYRAPPGLFANTGVLYLTQIPQQTLTSGVTIFVFTIGFIIALSILQWRIRDSLITLFVARFTPCFMPFLVVWAMSGVLTMWHSTMMHIPLTQNLDLMIGRGIANIGAAVCAVMSIVLITKSMSNEEIFSHLYRRRYDSLCVFYERHKCSGFYYSCIDSAMNNSLCSSCVINYPDRECFVDIWRRLQLVTLPLLLLSLFLLLSSVNGLMVLVKLYLIARSIAATHIISEEV